MNYDRNTDSRSAGESAHWLLESPALAKFTLQIISITYDRTDLHAAIGTERAFAPRQMGSQASEVRVRAELRLAPPVSGGQKRDDLVAFAGFCAARIARDLKGIGTWDLFVVSGIDGHADAVVRVEVGRESVEARASACDPAHAIWNAMCQVEQPLRDACITARRTFAA
jgi:hypothetical protein